MSPPMSSRWLFIATAVLLVAWRPAPVAVARPAAAGPDPAAETWDGEPDVRHTPPPTGLEPVRGPDAFMSDMPAAGDVLSASLRADDPDDETTKQPDLLSIRDSLAILNRQSHAENANTEDKYVDSPTPDKDLRIKSIKSQMLNFMGWASRTPSPIPIMKAQPNVSVLMPSVQQVDVMRALYDNVNTYPAAESSDTFTEKTQSFYPICEIPKNMNEEVWNSKESMNLMFNISFPRAFNGASMNVSSARLRLFKQYVSCYSQSSHETDDTPQTFCQPSFSEEGIKRSSNTNSSSSAENLSLSMDDRQIRVSVYVRSLKKKKVKRRLLDSRMIPYYGEKWTEWNIHRAVKNWRSPVRNFALSVEVEDEYGNFLPVNRFFKPMNCTGDVQMTTPKPIPGFLMEAVHFGLPPVTGNEAASNMSAAQALSLNMYRYPIADVTTVEWPAPEDAAYRLAKDTFVQSLADAVQQAAMTGGAQADHETSSEHHQHVHHRIRHGGGGGGGGGSIRHKINSTDVQSAVAKLTRDYQQQQQQQQATASLKNGADVTVGTEILD